MGVKEIPIDKAELLSTILEGILYGFSLFMFGATIWVLFYRPSTQKVNRPMLVVACLLLLCSTAHLVIDIIRVSEGFISYRDTQGGPVTFFSDVSHWTFVSKNYIYAIQTLIGDVVILYRCSVVWQSKIVMVVLALFWCATGVTGIASANAEWRTTEVSVFGGATSDWIKAFYATAFATNILSTSLLAYRIRHFDRRVANLRDRSGVRGILRTIIEAGAIYFVVLLALMICFSLRSNSQFLILDMIVPIIAITFYMVIIRVGLSNNSENQQTSTNLSSCVDLRDGQQAHNMTLPAPVLDINLNQRSSMGSIIAAIGNENHRNQSEIKPNNAV